ncbi:hypothetical protein [Actinomadura nitritigenes]|uniref:hypothetical protein n=1 Tax=Actinomadura nitritigenes TaxID=134602 RepID=UPI003D92BFA5
MAMAYRKGTGTRRWGACLAGSALLGALVLALAPTASAAPPDPSAFTMTWVPSPGNDTIPLAKDNLTNILTSTADWTATSGGSCAALAAEKNTQPPVDSSFCWQMNDAYNDNAVPYWIPQGVSTVSDSVDDESWNGNRAVMVSWYYDNSDGKDPNPGELWTNKGVRLTVLNPDTKKYKHILLVEPTTGPGMYKPVQVHAGGIVWYGRKIYIADTKNGLREFSLDNIYDLVKDARGDSTDNTKVGYNEDDDKFYSYGYRYIIPQSGQWKSKNAGPDDYCNQGTGPLRNSWLFLDRHTVPDRLVIGEYCDNKADDGSHPPQPPGRMVAWNIKDGELDNANWVATGDSAWELPRFTDNANNTTQGGGTNDGGANWYFNTSSGEHNGTLRHWRYANGSWSKVQDVPAPIGPEDMSYSRNWYPGRFWSITEHLDHRIIYTQCSAACP